jgi:hypothetical protein
MLISLIENEVQYPFGLNLALTVDVPDLKRRQLVEIIIDLKFRNNDKLLERIVEVFLVVVERGVREFLYFLLLLAEYLFFCFFRIFNIQRTE